MYSFELVFRKVGINFRSGQQQSVAVRVRLIGEQRLPIRDYTINLRGSKLKERLKNLPLSA